MAFNARERRRVTSDCSEGGLTEQAHAKRCDVHRIVKDYQKTGFISHSVRQPPQFMDVPQAMDFREAMTIMARGQQTFEALDPNIRKRFENDPAQFLDLMGPSTDIMAGS